MRTPSCSRRHAFTEATDGHGDYLKYGIFTEIDKAFQLALIAFFINDIVKKGALRFLKGATTGNEGAEQDSSGRGSGRGQRQGAQRSLTPQHSMVMMVLGEKEHRSTEWYVHSRTCILSMRLLRQLQHA